MVSPLPVSQATWVFGPYLTTKLERHPPSPAHPPIIIRDHTDMERLIRPLLVDQDREFLLAIPLDAHRSVLGVQIAGIGLVNHALIHPREVFKAAILCNASSLILAHNHPEGDETPSNDDLETTKRLAEAGKILGIEIADHLIVGTHSCLSFARKGWL